MKRERTAWLLLAAALALGPARPAQSQGYFKDVPPNHWAYSAVNELAALGILRGYPATPPGARPEGQRPQPPPQRSQRTRPPANRGRSKPPPTRSHPSSRT